jgi:hypothetical protein
MKTVPILVTVFCLGLLPGLLSGCGGPDLDNPGRIEPVDTPEELEMMEEMEAELEELAAEEEGDL